MEDSFRNTLIIISAVVIGAIFVHGLWTIRKNKNPYKLKARNAKVEPLNSEVDQSGFDQFGVGQVKVANSATLTDNAGHSLSGNPAARSAEQALGNKPGHPSVNSTGNESAEMLTSTAGFSPTSVQDDLSEPVFGAIDDIDTSGAQLSGRDSSSFTRKSLLSEAEEEILTPVTIDKPVYQEPVTRPKPKAQPVAQSQPAPKPESVVPEVLVLSVVMPQNKLISGAALLPSLLTLGMKYGDMGIFHRHQDNAGNGKVTFSLANMMNPGSFDLDSMESFATQGISLFMTLPNVGNAFEVFEQMLSAAKQLAQEFDGQVLDDKRNVMTKQTEQHYTGKIREFERKHCIAGA